MNRYAIFWISSPLLLHSKQNKTVKIVLFEELLVFIVLSAKPIFLNSLETGDDRSHSPNISEECQSADK